MYDRNSKENYRILYKHQPWHPDFSNRICIYNVSYFHLTLTVFKFIFRNEKL